MKPNDRRAPPRHEREDAEAYFRTSEEPPSPGEKDSTPYVMIEIQGPNLKLLEENHVTVLGLTCRKGVTVAQIDVLTEQMRKLLNGIKYTREVR